LSHLLAPGTVFVVEDFAHVGGYNPAGCEAAAARSEGLLGSGCRVPT